MFVLYWMICICIFNIADGDQSQPVLLSELHNVFSNLSSLALMPELMQTKACRRDCEIYRDAFYRNEMWAAEMFDANGRPSSSLLKGNINQRGHLPQCIYASSETSKIDGKFCYANIYTKPLQSNTSTERIWNRIFHKTVFTSDPFKLHLGPGQNAIIKGLCVPSTCQISEIWTAMKQILQVFNHSRYNMIVHVEEIKEENCLTKSDYIYESWIFWIIKKFFITMFYLVCLATLIEYYFSFNRQVVTSKSGILESLSLLQNIKTLLNVEHDKENLRWLCGLRCGMYFFMHFFHYSARVLIFANDRSDFNEGISNIFMTTLTKSAALVLDVLVFLSAISNSYKLTKVVAQNEERSIIKFICYRYFRFLMFIVAFLCFGATAINRHECSLLYTPPRHYNIWPIIFCYENLFGLHNMFYAPTHTFYTDMQLYVFGCAVLIIMKRQKNKTRIFLSMILSSLLCRSIVIYFLPNMPPLLMNGGSIRQFMDKMTLMYVNPFSRLPFYLAGMGLGYFARQNINIFEKISAFKEKMILCIALLCYGITLLSYYPLAISEKYNSFDGAVYTWIHTFAALISFSLIVFYCHIFENSLLSKILGCNAFVILNRLTSYFSILHLLILFTDLCETRVPFQHKLAQMFGFDYLIYTILACVFMKLFIHLPVKNLFSNLFSIKSKRNFYNQLKIN